MLWIKTYYVNVWNFGYNLHLEVTLHPNSTVIGNISACVNATDIWVIPKTGRMIPWRDYVTIHLTLRSENGESALYEPNSILNLKTWSTIDVIISLICFSDGQTSYLHEKNVRLIEIY